MRMYQGSFVLAALAAGVVPCEAITIVSPAQGTRVAPGQTISIVVAPEPGEIIAAADAAIDFITATPLAAGATAGQFEGTLTVPRQTVGPMIVVATATLDTGRLDIDSVTLDVEPGLVRMLSLAARRRLSFAGQVDQVVVWATFEDGVRRDISGPDKGTTYASSNPAVLGVHLNGFVQARARGEAELTVTNRGVQESLVVIVDVPDPPTNHIPVPNPGPARTVPKNLTVELDGTGSTDPDGDALEYRWEQVDGILVRLIDEFTPRPKFNAPYVTSPSIVVFALVVRDSHGATSFPALVSITVTP